MNSTIFDDIALLPIRFFLGSLMVVHGYQLLLSKEDRVQLIPMMSGLGVPRIAFELSAILAFFGGLFTMVGLIARIVAILFIIFMTATIILYITRLASILPLGAFDKDFKRSKGYIKGWELDTMVIATSLAILSRGAGTFSLDAILSI